MISRLALLSPDVADVESRGLVISRIIDGNQPVDALESEIR
jgi:hypothetical protein